MGRGRIALSERRRGHRVTGPELDALVGQHISSHHATFSIHDEHFSEVMFCHYVSSGEHAFVNKTKGATRLVKIKEPLHLG